MKLKLVLLGLAATAAAGYVLYRRNIKKISKQQAQEKDQHQELGIDIDKLDQDLSSVSKDYGDVRRFSDLPVPCQLVRLLHQSDNWDPEFLDWKTAVYQDEGAPNSVHVLFKEGKSEEGYPDNRIGFFIEVPAIISAGSSLKYKNYVEFLNIISQSFWAEHRVVCSKPMNVDIVGLYSKTEIVKDEETGLEAEILRYHKIPTNVLKAHSRYNDRLDGLYSFYSDVRRERADNGREITPDDVQDVHLFMGIWFKLEHYETDTYGITMKQVLQFLEELVLKDNYCVEDYNHRNKQKLGPVIIHPANELEFILDKDLKTNPILY